MRRDLTEEDKTKFRAELTLMYEACNLYFQSKQGKITCRLTTLVLNRLSSVIVKELNLVGTCPDDEFKKILNTIAVFMKEHIRRQNTFNLLKFVYYLGEKYKRFNDWPYISATLQNIFDHRNRLKDRLPVEERSNWKYESLEAMEDSWNEIYKANVI